MNALRPRAPDLSILLVFRNFWWTEATPWDSATKWASLTRLHRTNYWLKCQLIRSIHLRSSSIHQYRLLPSQAEQRAEVVWWWNWWTSEWTTISPPSQISRQAVQPLPTLLIIPDSVEVGRIRSAWLSMSAQIISNKRLCNSTSLQPQWPLTTSLTPIAQLVARVFQDNLALLTMAKPLQQVMRQKSSKLSNLISR